MSAPAQVLFDAPGPEAKRNNVIISVVSAIVLAAILAYIIVKLADAGQFEVDKWTPFAYTDIQRTLLKGLGFTLQAAAVAAVLAIVVGVVFALLRLSPTRVLSLPGTIVLEIFRGVPVLLLMVGFFHFTQNSFWSVVAGLTLYNGMVLAEIIRAGILSVPKGQREAALAIGLRGSQVMQIVLMPQALRVMMPTIIAQVVVLLKDTALGYIVTYQELLFQINLIGRSYDNLIPTFLVGAAIYILLNMLVAVFARYLEKRLQRKQA